MKKLFYFVFFAVVYLMGVSTIYAATTGGDGACVDSVKTMSDAGVVSVKVYEKTGSVQSYSFTLSKVASNSASFSVANTYESYKVFLSDATGKASSTGSYVTISCSRPVTIFHGVNVPSFGNTYLGGLATSTYTNASTGNNIDAISITIGSTTKYADRVTHYSLGTGLSGAYSTSHGYVARALSSEDGSATFMGDNDSSFTVGFCAALKKPATTLTCTSPKVLNTAGDACVDPPLTCTSPKVLNTAGDACIDPPVTTTSITSCPSSATGTYPNCNCNPTTIEKKEFTYTGTAQTFTVPNNVTQMTVKAWGAGGGSQSTSVTGGPGWFTTATLNVTPATAYTVIVGQAGASVTGTNHYPFVADTLLGWQWGGLSGLFTGADALTETLQNRAVVIAGGGGWSVNDTTKKVYGGSGNADSSGTCTSGCTSTSMKSGSGTVGALSWSGGSGYKGWGEKITASSLFTGWSGFVISGATYSSIQSTPDSLDTVSSTSEIPPVGTLDPDYATNIGIASTNGAGNGRVVISYEVPSNSGTAIYDSATNSCISCSGANAPAACQTGSLCGEGKYYCYDERTCKGGNEPCRAVTCFKNNICDTNESCNCEDCTNGWLDDVDHCGTQDGQPLRCTKDVIECNTDRFPYCVPFCLDGYLYNPTTHQCIKNPVPIPATGGISVQRGACCPNWSSWNSTEARCVPDSCGVGYYYCANQKKCLPGGQDCGGTSVCNNNNICEGDESCQCADCVDATNTTDNKDRCAIINGQQAYCSDDVTTDTKPGACCIPPEKWDTTAAACSGCTQTSAPSELKANTDQPFITCNGWSDATLKYFRYRIKNKTTWAIKEISDAIYENGTYVVWPTLTAGTYTVECFYGTQTNVDTSTSNSPDSCVKTMTVNDTAQGCSRIFPYRWSTLSDELMSVSPFQANFRTGSRNIVGAASEKPYLVKVGSSAPAFLDYDSVISGLFHDIQIGPVSKETSNFSFVGWTTEIVWGVRVGNGYSTNSSCRVSACVGNTCGSPSSFVVTNSANTVCTNSLKGNYNIGCNPQSADVDTCVAWLQSAITANGEAVGNNTKFSVKFRFGGTSAPLTNVDCIKYAPGQMPWGMNVANNVICEATDLNNGEIIPIYAADQNDQNTSLQTVAKTVELDREDPKISDVRYYADGTLTTEISSRYWYNRSVVAAVTCTDTPQYESLACACSPSIHTSTTNSYLWSTGMPFGTVGADTMRYTRPVDSTITTDQVEIGDTAGNTSHAPKTLSFYIDTTPPAVDITAGSATTRTITVTDSGSKIWKTTTAPTGATNYQWLIYRIWSASSLMSTPFNDDCNTVPVYATTSDTSSSSTLTASITIQTGETIAYCVRDNAGNTVKGFYPSVTGACFSASNMTNVPNIGTYSDAIIARLGSTTGTDATKYGYSFSEDSATATCFRTLLDTNITTLVNNQYTPRTDTNTLSWANGPAVLKGTSTLNTNGYYYYDYTGKSDKTLVISENITGAGNKVVVVGSGNIRISSDIVYTWSDKVLVIIARKNASGDGGNISIAPQVHQIDAILIADGGALVADSPLTVGTRLTINWRIYSYNTRGGSLVVNSGVLTNATTGKVFTNSTLTNASDLTTAQSQDLERFRLMSLDGSNVCSLFVNYYSYTTTALPAILRRQTGLAGTCSF